MNVRQQLSPIHRAKIVSYGWRMNDRHILPIIGTISMVSLLTANVSPAFSLSQDETLKPDVKQISKTKIGSSYLYVFEYCHSKNNVGVLGFLVISNIESIPVLISPNIKTGECQKYGAKIQLDKSDFVKTKLFTNNDLPKLIKDFENKKMTLEDKLVREQQILNTYYKTSASKEKISEQLDKISILKELIKSTRSSIVLLKSV